MELNNETGVFDISVSVQAVWSGPNGFTAYDTAQPNVENTNLYTSMAMVSSFGSEQSGVYTCSVTVSSTFPFLTNSSSQNTSISICRYNLFMIMYKLMLTFSTQITDVVTAPIKAPENFYVVSTSRRVSQFSWSPPSLLNSTTVIAGYTLTCTSRVAGVSTVTMNYTEIRESYSLGGFRPATEYNCSVFASNSAGDGPPASTSVTTMDDGEL